jgi:hypothetical protein
MSMKLTNFSVDLIVALLNGFIVSQGVNPMLANPMCKFY